MFVHSLLGLVQEGNFSRRPPSVPFLAGRTGIPCIRMESCASVPTGICCGCNNPCSRRFRPLPVPKSGSCPDEVHPSYVRRRIPSGRCPNSSLSLTWTGRCPSMTDISGTVGSYSGIPDPNGSGNAQEATLSSRVRKACP